MSDRKPVGYGRPPVHTRFKKGQSGNPSGRPKKAATLAEDLAAELAEQIQITVGGKSRRISKQRALVKAVTAKGIKGDARAASLLLNFVRLIEADPKLAGAETLSPADLKILEDHLEREVQRRQAKDQPQPQPQTQPQPQAQPQAQHQPTPTQPAAAAAQASTHAQET